MTYRNRVLTGHSTPVKIGAPLADQGVGATHPACGTTTTLTCVQPSRAATPRWNETTVPAPPENAAATLALIRARAEAAAALREDCDDLLNNPLAVFTVGYTKRGSECR